MPPKANTPEVPESWNRRLPNEPVVLSDGSEKASKPTALESIVAPAVAAVPPSSGEDPEPAVAVARVENEDVCEASEEPPQSLGQPQAQPPPTDGVAAAWDALVADGLRTVETAERSATVGPSATAIEIPVRTEPGSVGTPHRAPMIGPLSLDWLCFPKSEGSFTFDDLVALGRRDARLVQAFTDTDAAWAEPARSRFLRNFWVGYKVPQSLPCDRTMIFDSRDGLYLEGMIEFLSGKRDLPTSVRPEFWVFDLPVPLSARTRTGYDYLRTQWTATYGFGRIITFAEHDALLVDEGTSDQFDVVTAAGARQTKCRAPLDSFPALPSWITGLRLPGGLCMRIPRILMYLGSEVEYPDRFQAQANRLAYVVRLETARCVANALDLDYRFSQIVWIVSDEVLALLHEFASTPKVIIPAKGEKPECLRGIAHVEAACRSARSLGEEYTSSRGFTFPQGSRFVGPFFTPAGFVKANEFKGVVRFAIQGGPLLITA